MYHKWQPYDIWFLRYEPSNTDFFVILGHFLPLTSPKIKIFNKIKNKNTKRYNHFTQVEPKIMIICYTVSEIWHVTDVTFIFHFCLFFALLPPLQPKNWKIQKNENTPGDITSFYTSVPKIMIKCSIVPETWCMTDVIVIFHLGFI